MSFLITDHVCAQLPQAELTDAVAQRIGQRLRRASPLVSLALLACWDVLAQKPSTQEAAAPSEAGHAWAPSNGCSTALIWHSLQGPQPETEALLAAQQTSDGLLLPFDFLASQPGLLGVQLKPWLPDLAQTLFLPGTAHPQEQAWMQMLQFAHFALAQKRFGRVICAALERDGGICRYAAISLVTDSLTGVSGVVTGSAHGGMHGPLLRGCWLPHCNDQPDGNGGNAYLASAVSPVPADQADAALWRWLESPCAMAAAEQTVLLRAQGADLRLQRRHA